MNLTVRVTDAGRTGKRVKIVELIGELDAYTSLELRETVVRLIEEGAKDIIINLEKVDFIDSVGLGTLVGCLKRAQQHDGSIDLTCCNGMILKVFDITGLSGIFEVYFSQGQALSRDRVRRDLRVTCSDIAGYSTRVSLHQRSVGFSFSGHTWLFSIQAECETNRVLSVSEALIDWARDHAANHDYNAVTGNLPSEGELSALLSSQLGANVKVVIFKPES